MEAEAKTWIEALLGEELGPDPLMQSLKSGVALCHLVNKLQPGSCAAPSPSKMPFKQMENIGKYLKACEALKVPALIGEMLSSGKADSQSAAAALLGAMLQYPEYAELFEESHVLAPLLSALRGSRLVVGHDEAATRVAIDGA